MAGSLNKVQLIGRLGRDPESRNLNNGAAVVSLRVATTEAWGKGSERQERTEWHSVVIFNEKLGEVAAKYLRKGSPVFLEGALQTRKWQGQDGQDRYTTEVVLGKFAGNLVLLSDGKRGAEEDDADRGEAPDPSGHRKAPGWEKATGRGGGGGGGSGAPRGGGGSAWKDDDIPF